MIPRGVDIKNRIALEKCYSEHGEYRIVVTVRHTGTHSILEQYPGYKHWHCNPLAYDLIQSTFGKANVLTTFRDPKRVAASWFNRGQLPTSRMYSGTSEGCIFSWKEAWDYYGKILEMIPRENVYFMKDLKHKLYTHGDVTGAHTLLDNNNMDQYYKLIDQDLIGYAYQNCKRLINDD